MARSRARKTEVQTAETAAANAADVAVANDPTDPFGEALAAAQADDLARRQQEAMARDAAQTAQPETNGLHGEPDTAATPASVNGQPVGREGEEQPRRRATEVITDAAAKMRMHSNHETYKVAITFDDGKPSDQVRQALKDGGFRWDGQGAWEKPVSYDTRVRDRLNAERVFEAVADMRKEEAGIAHTR